MLVLSPSVADHTGVGVADAALDQHLGVQPVAVHEAARPRLRQPLKRLGVLVDHATRRARRQPCSLAIDEPTRPQPTIRSFMRLAYQVRNAGATAWLRRFSVSCRGRDRHITHQDRTARIRHRRLRRPSAAARERRVDRARHRPAGRGGRGAGARSRPPSRRAGRRADDRLRTAARRSHHHRRGRGDGRHRARPRARAGAARSRQVGGVRQQAAAVPARRRAVRRRRAKRRAAAVRGQRLRRDPGGEGAARVDDRDRTCTGSTASSTAPPTSS